MVGDPSTNTAVIVDSVIDYDSAAGRAANIHVKDGIGEDEFVAMRTARDKSLGAPMLITP